MSTPPTTLASIRAAFATAIQQAGYKAYAQPLATVIPPGVIIVPDEPYLEANTLASGGTIWQVNLTLIVVVAYLDNQAALKNLEDIVVKVCANLPRGTAFDVVQQPTVEEVGPSSLLTCRIPVSIRANLTAPA
jgi:hypothetical protein